MNRLQLGLIVVLSVVAAGFLVMMSFEPPSPASPNRSTVEADSAPPAEDALSNAPLRILRFTPDDYYLTHKQAITDTSGQTIKNTILLPELPTERPVTGAKESPYVGPEACQECHAEYYDDFVKTAHYQTSAPANARTVLGAFSQGRNRLKTASDQLEIEMLQEDERLIQRIHLNNGDSEYTADFPFAFVTGSGKVGQTYLYWQSSFLYQLHASYVSSMDAWVNSPGYTDGAADFARPVLPLCLECHTTHVEHVAGTLQYSRENMVLGVTCEKCHGPGKEHVDFHTSNPDATESKYITNPSGLSSERELEVCQLCHGGMPKSIRKAPFSYRPGDNLAEFYEPNPSTELAGIHSNTQLPRLRESKCFTQSQDMTCVDCHNPHKSERGDMRLFSDRCLECHSPANCGKFELLGDRLAENCIDCHMPVRTMEDIVVQSGASQFSPQMRDHFIGVWEAESNRFLRDLTNR